MNIEVPIKTPPPSFDCVRDSNGKPTAGWSESGSQRGLEVYSPTQGVGKSKGRDTPKTKKRVSKKHQFCHSEFISESIK